MRLQQVYFTVSMRKSVSAGGQVQPRKRKRRRWWKRLLAYLTLLMLILLLGGMTFAGVLYYQVAQMMPSVSAIETYQPREASFIYSADGVQLARIAEEYREPATLEEIPKHLINATIAKEDRRFWQHSGVDWRGTARALWVNLTEGDIRQGGSTLTQQLARNVFLTQKRTFARKMQEIILAQEMERRLTKERILELYLNQVYYGNGAYGVKAAARVYFNKPLERLTLAECALLASLPQRPSAYDPFSNPDEAIFQRNLTLNLMAREGYITPDQRDAAKAEPLRLARSRPQTQFRAPYFVMDVLRDLEQEVERGASAEDCARQLRVRRFRLAAAVGNDVVRIRQHGDAEKHSDQQRRHDCKCDRGVARFWFFEGRNAVGNGFDAGQRRASGSECTQNQKQGERADAVSQVRRWRRRRRGHVPGDNVKQPRTNQKEHAGNEGVCRNGEHRARFLDAAQVCQADQSDQSDCQFDTVWFKRGPGGRNCRYACRHTHCDGENIVDQER